MASLSKAASVNEVMLSNQGLILADDAALAGHCDILVQVDNFESGGLENVVIDLNNVLIAAGYEVILLVLGTQGKSVVRARELGQKLICGVYSDDAYSALLDKISPRLVIAHYSFAGIEICQSRKIPFIQIIHNIYMWFDERQLKEFAILARQTSLFVAVSESARNYSISRLGVPPEKCLVISNGIDFTPFDRMDKKVVRERLRSKYGLRPDEFVFLSVGSINHQKNHLGTIKAFEMAQKDCSYFRLLILGPVYEGQLLDEIQSYIDDHELKDKVLYCGAAAGAHEYFAMADAYVSGSFFEGGPLALLEALKSNLPIVTSNVGVAPKFEGRSGVYVVEPPVNMVDFYGTIFELASNQDFEGRLANAMVRAGSLRVRPDFSDSQLAALEKSYTYAQYLRLFSTIINGKGWDDIAMQSNVECV